MRENDYFDYRPISNERLNKLTIYNQSHFNNYMLQIRFTGKGLFSRLAEKETEDLDKDIQDFLKIV